MVPDPLVFRLLGSRGYRAVLQSSAVFRSVITVRWYPALVIWPQRPVISITCHVEVKRLNPGPDDAADNMIVSRFLGFEGIVVQLSSFAQTTAFPFTQL